MFPTHDHTIFMCPGHKLCVRHNVLCVAKQSMQLASKQELELSRWSERFELTNQLAFKNASLPVLKNQPPTCPPSLLQVSHASLFLSRALWTPVLVWNAASEATLSVTRESTVKESSDNFTLSMLRYSVYEQQIFFDKFSIDIASLYVKKNLWQLLWKWLLGAGMQRVPVEGASLCQIFSLNHTDGQLLHFTIFSVTYLSTGSKARLLAIEQVSLSMKRLRNFPTQTNEQQGI